MTAFMWSRPLNSVSWEITTQKKLKKKFDGTNTQMVDWMMNKCRGRMIQGDYIIGNIFHRKRIRTKRDFRVLLENDQKTEEKKSLLESGIYQLSCLLFSWKTLLNTIITVIKLTEAQFFNPSSTNLLTRVHQAKIQYYLGLSLENVTLCVLVIKACLALWRGNKIVRVSRPKRLKIPKADNNWRWALSLKSAFLCGGFLA